MSTLGFLAFDDFVGDGAVRFISVVLTCVLDLAFKFPTGRLITEMRRLGGEDIVRPTVLLEQCRKVGNSVLGCMSIPDAVPN